MKRHTLNTPKAQLSLSVSRLQELLWLNREFPKYFNSFRASPELMKIYKVPLIVALKSIGKFPI